MVVRRFVLILLAVLLALAAATQATLVGRQFGASTATPPNSSGWYYLDSKLTMGFDDTANWGVSARGESTHPCPTYYNPTYCVYNSEQYSRHGSSQVGMRFHPERDGPNIELLGKMSGSWGYSYLDAVGTLQHVCLLDNSVNCGGHPEYPAPPGTRSQSQSRPDAGAALLNLPSGSPLASVRHAVQFGSDQLALPIPPAHFMRVDVDVRAGAAIEDFVYRRAIVFAPPTTNSVDGSPSWDTPTRVSIDTAYAEVPLRLRATSTNGFGIGDPTAPLSLQWTGPEGPDCAPVAGPGTQSGGGAVVDSGPCRQGLLFEYDAGDIAAGQLHRITWFIGALPTVESAYENLTALGADVWAVATPPDYGESGNDVPVIVWFMRGLYTPLPPDVVIDLPEPACFGDAVLVEDDSFVAAPSLLRRNRWTIDGVVGPWNEPPAAWAGSFAAPGSHVVTLESETTDGLSASQTTTLEALDCTPPPTASFLVVTPQVGDCAPSTFRFIGFAASTAGGPLHPLTSGTLEFGDGSAPLLFTAPFPTEVAHEYSDSASHTVTWTVLDDRGDSDAVSIVVAACPNRTPDVRAPELMRIPTGAPATVHAFATDPDLGDTMTLNALGVPAGASFPPLVGPSFSLNQALTWTPDASQVGTHAVTFRVADAAGATDSATVLLVVYRAGQSPPDSDRDGVPDSVDNCPTGVNGLQGDDDADGVGDFCQSDLAVRVDSSAGPLAPDQDQDGVGDLVDNCVATPNALQGDLDRDGRGDACDIDQDGDGVPEIGIGVGLDNCPAHPNEDQADADADLVGDACQLATATKENPVLAVASRSRLPRQGSENQADWTLAVAAGLLVAGALLGALLGRLRPWFWAAAFSRLKGDRLLEHPVRQQLVAIVQAQPGIHFTGLVRASGRSRGAVEHHVNRLVAAGLLQCRRTPGFQCYWAGDPPGEATEDRLKTTTARDLLEHVRSRPGLPITEVARSLGLSHSRVSYHVKRLRSSGLLDARRDGAVVLLFPGDPKP